MRKKTLGFTLTETLVAIVIGMISVAAAFSAYNYFNKSYASISQKAAISKSAREALSLISRDIKNAGYIDPNFVGNSSEGISSERQARLKLLSVSSKRPGLSGKYGQSDFLGLWYTTSPIDRKRVFYWLVKHQNSNDYYLARDVVMNSEGGPYWSHPVDTELLIPHVDDFQVIFKDKDGKVLVPVCVTSCGPVEDAQGRLRSTSTPYGNMNLGQANQAKVHTADIYLTIRTPKEVYSKARRTKIQNGESPHGSNLTIPADKYHRETFFVSVHTRNLATPQVKIASSGQSVGVGTGYNK